MSNKENAPQHRVGLNYNKFQKTEYRAHVGLNRIDHCGDKRYRKNMDLLMTQLTEKLQVVLFTQRLCLSSGKNKGSRVKSGYGHQHAFFLHPQKHKGYRYHLLSLP